jgi:hypothetical protein
VKCGTVGHPDHKREAWSVIAPFVDMDIDALDRTHRKYPGTAWDHGCMLRVRECRNRPIESHPGTKSGDRGKYEKPAQCNSPRRDERREKKERIQIVGPLDTQYQLVWCEERDQRKKHK